MDGSKKVLYDSFFFTLCLDMKICVQPIHTVEPVNGQSVNYKNCDSLAHKFSFEKLGSASVQMTSNLLCHNCLYTVLEVASVESLV